MTFRDKAGLARQALLIGIASPLLATTALAGSRANGIFETNVTNDRYISSGEPEIAVDPKNPRHLAIIEFAIGSKQAPGADYNPQARNNPELNVARSKYDGRIMLSTDRGEHWHQAGTPPASDPNSRLHGGSDVMIAIGPDDTIYAADEAAPASVGRVAGGTPPTLQEYLSHFNFLIAASTDGGHKFSPAQIVGTPVDRPWMTVDQSTGTVYTVSSGALDVKTGVHNVAGPNAPEDRWLVAWKPHLAGKSEPRRIGGPVFSGEIANTITAANGVVAATFALGGRVPGMGFTGAPPKPVPVPASLRGLVPRRITQCTMAEPCLFFETSSDEGRHWVRHFVDVPGGFDDWLVNVSADPSHPGRYAIAFLSSDRKAMKVIVTNDAGAIWSGPVTIPNRVAADGADFKQWMAYGPTGVLGAMWRKERPDLPMSRTRSTTKSARRQIPGQVLSPAYDIYTSISCDGGTKWYPAIRVDAKTSPAGMVSQDDESYIALDAHYEHLVWGDRRTGIVQAFYGRVPFSIFTHGKRCGGSRSE